MQQVNSGITSIWGKNPDWDTVITAMDTNRDGVIDYDEFMTAAADREKLLTTTNLKNAFKALDKNGNGKVDAEEIKAAFAQGNLEDQSFKGVDVKGDFWEKLMAELDANKDGEISYEEFESHMLEVINQGMYYDRVTTPR